MEREKAKRDRNMKVICIRDRVPFQYSQPGYREWELTIGKAYDVLLQGKDNNKETIYFIQDDSGELCWYGKTSVNTIEEWREKRLKEIGI